MTDHDPSARSARSVLSSRVEPFWLNPATIKGTVAIAVGLMVLLVPTISASLLRIVIGAGLVIGGLSDLRFRSRVRQPGRARGIAEGLVTASAGIAFVAWPSTSIRIITLIAGGYLLVRGAVVLTGSLGERRRGDPWLIHAARGAFLIALSVIAVFLPEALIGGTLAAAAALAVILGAIMLVYGIRQRSDAEIVDVDSATVSMIIVDWMHSRDLGDGHRAEIADELNFEEPERGPKLVAWWVMLALSVAIATFGVMQDSTAVVIGAMLIAPLMTPILGVAAGIVNLWEGRILSSLVLVALGTGGAVLIAFIIGQWLPSVVPLEANSQITSRTSPNLIDMLIALAAGAAGAYANVDRRVSASIAGVAIAVALVPPLAVVGLTLQAGAYGDAGGAFLLFLTNLVSIILAAAAVFFLTGFASLERLRAERERVLAIFRTVGVAALVILVPLAFTIQGIVSSAGRQGIAREAVSEWIGEDSDLRAQRIALEGTEVRVFLTGPGRIPPVEALEDALSSEFGAPASVRVEHAPTVVLEYSDEDGLTEKSPDIGTGG